jgi:hypothetical protein
MHWHHYYVRGWCQLFLKKFKIDLLIEFITLLRFPIFLSIPVCKKISTISKSRIEIANFENKMI